MRKFMDLFRKSRSFEESPSGREAFAAKYRSFQSLLASNSHSLELVTDLEQLCYGTRPFSLDQIVQSVEELLATVYDIAEDLNALSGARYPGLFDAVERIGVGILRNLSRRTRVEKGHLTISFRNMSLDRLSEVGGKAANLGEVGNRVHLPVPRGFAVTAWACLHFMTSNRLHMQIKEVLKGLDIEDTAALLGRTEQARDLILASPLPADLEERLLAEVDQLVRETGPQLRLAVRSSATSEDSEASFAGQHSSVLNVRRDGIARAYKEVVASTFNPRAVYYRRSKGYPDQDVVMSVLCVTMVDAKASGVMYTRDPNDHSRNVVLVNSVWGLGANVVDGSAAADHFELDKADGRLLESRAAVKDLRLVLHPDQGVVQESIPAELRPVPSLEPETLATLLQYGLTLEEHYGMPLDIEWALDRQNRLVVLQARQLNIDLTSLRPAGPCEEPDRTRQEVDGFPVLARGVTASRGKACGLAYVLTSDHNLLNIPEGSILVAAQTSPRYVSILGRVQAIVTDVGSVTGHMASVAREFGVPTLVGAGRATSAIRHGEEITVDATKGVVYQGRVEAILERKRPVNPMKGSPTYKMAHEALKKIALLNLVEPDRPEFSPEGCQTLHDVIRFAHEMSMQEMFRISDDLDIEQGFAVRVRAPLPMKIMAVDLGGGLEVSPGQHEAGMDQVSSVPFQALLRGMTRSDIRWIGSVGMDWKGFMTILAESATGGHGPDERMGGPSYTVLSRDYLNFNSRLGYHFAVIDSFCGPRINDNYISFSFKGGAADIGRRSRRARLIAKVLKRLGFKTEMRGDMVKGVIKKYDCQALKERLDMLGRLLGAVRLLDMVLSDDGHVDWYVDEFFKGNYTFERGSKTASAKQP